MRHVLERVDVRGTRLWRIDELKLEQLFDLRQRHRVGVWVTDGVLGNHLRGLLASGRLDDLRSPVWNWVAGRAAACPAGACPAPSNCEPNDEHSEPGHLRLQAIQRP